MSSRDASQDEDDPLSLPICARDICDELYDLATWLDEEGSFPAKISLRSKMTIFHDFRKILGEQKLYNEFKGICFGDLIHIPDYLIVNAHIVHYMLLLHVRIDKNLHEIRFCANDKTSCFDLK